MSKSASPTKPCYQSPTVMKLGIIASFGCGLKIFIFCKRILKEYLPSRRGYTMFCILTFLFFFIIPFPIISNIMLLLFLLMVAIETKPCFYCSMMVLAWLTLSCSIYGSNGNGTELVGNRCYFSFADSSSLWLLSRPKHIVYPPAFEI